MMDQLIKESQFTASLSLSFNSFVPVYAVAVLKKPRNKFTLGLLLMLHCGGA
jgi:hypothetical protein